jgi:hypothetical protein
MSAAISGTEAMASLSDSRQPFRVLNPATQEIKYLHYLEARTGRPRRARRREQASIYYAISYVWSDWKIRTSDNLPNWNLIHGRLLQLSTTPLFESSETSPEDRPEAFHCWVDCKCIDQASASDKAYWVPRMNNIFYGAKCTLLLLRNIDLTGVFLLNERIKCSYAPSTANETAVATTSQHQCLFDPSCVSLQDVIAPEVESLCLDALQALWNGEWRKRAWIFQEILLSERYILTWGDTAEVYHIDLERIGYITAFLHARHPQRVWLYDFWSWCKRCACIRQFYTEDCDMGATILPLAESLVATIPCDKYYALCGILGLETIQYNPLHTAEEAMDVVIAALTLHGRMGWVYAIPGSSHEEISFSTRNMAPFTLTKKRLQKSVSLRDPFFSHQYFGFNAAQRGQITVSDSFLDMHKRIGLLGIEILRSSRLPGQHRNFLLSHYKRAPFVERNFFNLLFRLGYDEVLPLCNTALMKILFRALDNSRLNLSLLEDDENRECCLWFITISLCYIGQRELNRIRDAKARQAVHVFGAHLKHLCERLAMEKNLRILQWQPLTAQSPTAASDRGRRLAAYNGPLDPAGKIVWSVESSHSSNSLLFIADEAQRTVPLPEQVLEYAKASSAAAGPSIPASGSSATPLAFYGVLYQLEGPRWPASSYESAYHDEPDMPESHGARTESGVLDIVGILARSVMELPVQIHRAVGDRSPAPIQRKDVKFLTFRRSSISLSSHSVFSVDEDYTESSPTHSVHDQQSPTQGHSFAPGPPFAQPPPDGASSAAPERFMHGAIGANDRAGARSAANVVTPSLPVQSSQVASTSLEAFLAGLGFHAPERGTASPATPTSQGPTLSITGTSRCPEDHIAAQAGRDDSEIWSLITEEGLPNMSGLLGLFPNLSWQTLENVVSLRGPE